MAYAYIAEIKDGTRRMIRMLPDVVKTTDLRRKALSPGPTGRVLWEYPTTWLMTHPTGYWQESVKQKLEERVSRATWKTILSGNTKDKPGVGGESTTESASQDLYPAGMPLSQQEIRASRSFRPLNSAGQSLCWDHSSLAGCKAPAGQCARGVREVMKLTGLHPLIKMHLARRGGHRSEKRIPVKDIDGHVQNLRSLLTEEELKYKDKDKDKGKTKWIPKAGGSACNTALANQPTLIVAPTEMYTKTDIPETSQSWRTTVLPADFEAFDFTPLEGDTCALVNLQDEWVQRPIEDDAVNLLPSEIDSQQHAIDQWW